MSKECFRCGHFTAYYQKGYCCFMRTDCGYCRAKKETVEKHSTCDSWKSNYAPRKLKQKAILNGLEEALIRLNSIKLILDEKMEDIILFQDKP